MSDSNKLYKTLFEGDYNNLHVADKILTINKMIHYFLDKKHHNYYYVTNITSHIVYHTYDLVKFLDETDVTVNLGYNYCIQVLKTMYNKFDIYHFDGHLLFVEHYKQNLDIEINKLQS